MKRAAIAVAALVVVAAIFLSFFRPTSESDRLDLSEVIALASNGDVESIEVKGDSLTVRLQDERTLLSRKESGSTILELLSAYDIPLGGEDGVVVTVEEGSRFGNVIGLMIGFLPLIVLAGLFFWVGRQSRGAHGRVVDKSTPCPSCGSAVSEGWQYCAHCGQQSAGR